MADRAKKDGVDMAIWESSMRRTYREYAAQLMARNYWCSRGNCGNAAVPGTSNHGWGLAVDLMSMTQRNWVDRHGSFYGWAKKWSDAAWEWWHLKYRAGVYNPPPPGPRTLYRGCRPGNDVKYLMWMLQVIPLRHPTKRKKRYFKRSWKRHRVYGPRVAASVRQFQRDHGLKADGVCGPVTWKKIKAAYKRHHKS